MDEQPDAGEAPPTSVYEALEAFRGVLNAAGAAYRITVRTPLTDTNGKPVGPMITHEVTEWSEIEPVKDFPSLGQ